MGLHPLDGKDREPIRRTRLRGKGLVIESLTLEIALGRGLVGQTVDNVGNELGQKPKLGYDLQQRIRQFRLGTISIQALRQVPSFASTDSTVATVGSNSKGDLVGSKVDWSSRDQDGRSRGSRANGAIVIVYISTASMNGNHCINPWLRHCKDWQKLCRIWHVLWCRF
jgi:hypothetical protein